MKTYNFLWYISLPIVIISLTFGTCLGLARIDRNDPGNTPLIKACLANNLEQVKTLATKKSTLNVENANGFTALDFARSPDMGVMIQIRDVLVRAGAREGSHIKKK